MSLYSAFVVANDITERRKAQVELLESRNNFKEIFEKASDGVLIANSKTKNFIFANPRICEITGYSYEELLKMGVNNIHPEIDLLYVINQINEQLEGKITLATHIPILRKNGKTVYCDVNSNLGKFNDQECLVGFFREMTDQKKQSTT